MSVEQKSASGLAKVTVTDLARSCGSYLPQGNYDHTLQQLTKVPGAPQTTSVKDEDSGGSTTFWDGERG